MAHEEDLFDYFFNPEGLPDFIGQEFAAITSNFGSSLPSVGTGFSDLNFAFSEEVEEEYDATAATAAAYASSATMPSVPFVPSSPSLLSTLNNTLAHAHALIADVKEEVFSPGQSSDSGGYGEDEEFESGEVLIKGEVSPMMQTIATECFESDSCKQRKQRKRQRIESVSTVRLIKNRESAQKSRQRRKLYIEELERKVTHITAQNERLIQENKMLRDDLDFMTKRSPAVPSTELSTKRLVAPPRNIKAAGVCLLVVLFSFGLLFNSKNAHHNGLPSPINMGPFCDAVPEVIPALSDRQSHYANRVLKPAGETTVITTAAKPKLIPGAAAASSVPKRPQAPATLKRSRSGLPKSLPASTGLSLSAPSTTTTSTQSAIQPPQHQPKAAPAVSQVGQKTYLFCAEAREVVMAQEDAGCATTPTTPATTTAAPPTTPSTSTSMLSLLIPMEGFNGTEETEDGRGQGVLSSELQKLIAANKHNATTTTTTTATTSPRGSTAAVASSLSGRMASSAFSSGEVPSLIEVSCQIVSMNVYSPFSQPQHRSTATLSM